MAYTINKTDGSVAFSPDGIIADGTVNNSTSLQLFGKSYSNFGEGLNENLVKLLENSASSSAPSAPLRGELWFDTSTNQIKVYDGSSFKPTGGSKAQATATALKQELAAKISALDNEMKTSAALKEVSTGVQL